MLLKIAICMVTFSSCSKKHDVTPTVPIDYGSVMFWTKNDANLALCQNSISVYLVSHSPYGDYAVNTAYIRYTLPDAPTYCLNESSIQNLIPGIKYHFRSSNCAIGVWGPLDSFSVSPGECLKIEIR